MIVYELMRGLAYRRIRHGDMHWYRTTVPAGLTVVFVVAYFCLPVAPKLLGSDGLLASTLSVVSTLPGFYFAGLAAVATFAGLNMDRLMPGTAPILAIYQGNVWADVSLSRRQFLSYLFSYLVLTSFTLCIVILLANASAGSIADLRTFVGAASAWGAWLWWVMKVVALAGIVALASSIVVTTLHGMFFLSERIHQP